MKTWNYIGLDIGKETLFVQAPQGPKSYATEAAALQALVAHVQQFPDPLVVVEASGGYEKPILRLLWKAQVPVALVSPRRVREFARSSGQMAKTDPLDAALLQRFGETLKVTPSPPPPAEILELQDLLDQRTHLLAEQTRESNRLDKGLLPQVEASIRRLLQTLAQELREIEALLKAHIQAHPLLQKKFELLQSVDGVGPITAWAILAYLPEITTLNRNQLVALAGVAPFAKESGKWKGKRRISGGRGKLRAILFMAAKSAAVHNSVIKAYVAGLRVRGKCYKSAIVAAMRKLLLHLQSILKNAQVAEKRLAA